MNEQTPTARLRALLADMAIEGMAAPTVRDLVIPSIPYGDAEYWMRRSVGDEVRRFMADAGLVLNHADADETGIPAKSWIQYEIPEVVTHVQHVNKQTADDQAALDRRLAVWCEANPETGLTPADLRRMAEDDAA